VGWGLGRHGRVSVVSMGTGGGETVIRWGGEKRVVSGGGGGGEKSIFFCSSINRVGTTPVTPAVGDMGEVKITGWYNFGVLQ